MSVKNPAVVTDGANWSVVHQIVFPTDGETDTLPLYVDFNTSARTTSSAQRSERNRKDGSSQAPIVAQAAPQFRTDYLLGRRQLKLPSFRQVSFGTYFNAFPAAYWRANTNVQTVRLRVEVEGQASIIVYRSTIRGIANRVESFHVDDGGVIEAELSIKNFGDGGWLWFDLEAQSTDVKLVSAEWLAPVADARSDGNLSIAVTTFNRADYCVNLLDTLSKEDEVMSRIDRIQITDQGTKKVRDETGFDAASVALGEKLLLIEQANIGGSGGFARGMFETAAAAQSEYVLLLDDDVIIEPEGILRALRFANYTRTPSIVGGHMFNLYERSVLHSWGERINEYRWFWGPAPFTEEAHDFASSPLRLTPWVHRRIDVDFNGWWMCLIPTQVIREIGLSLPIFIKWDDSEFGVRAGRSGYPTVTLPGAAIWHMPWTEKDDTIDWQAYFHERNRGLTALLHSPYRNGGSYLKESFAMDVKHLLCLQYSAVALRHRALGDLLSGPNHLHRTITTVLPEIRAQRSSFTDAQIESEPATAFAPVRRRRPLSKGRELAAPSNPLQALKRAVTGAIRQIRPVHASALEHPEARVPAIDARWWRLSQYDSAVVSAADGSGASLYVRDPKKFRSMLWRSIVLHGRVRRRWIALQKQYRGALPEYTSPEAWKQTFGL